MKRRRKRECHGCGEGFLPDPRNRAKQGFCCKPECVKASVKKSQAKWRKKNANYFKDRENVLRVQEWRRANPGYWRRKEGGLTPVALQDDCIPEVPEAKRDTGKLEPFALREDWFSQPLLLVGLVANLTGIALQEDIVTAVTNLQKRGQEILGTPSRIVTESKTSIPYEEENHRSLAGSPRSGPVQPGRSPPDPSPAPAGCSSQAWALYLLLTTVADAEGISYYSAYKAAQRIPKK